jgi:hypothetical protein
MNTGLIFDILKLALSLAEAQMKGTAPQNLALDETLLEIVQKGAEAYQQHTGEALDLSLIKAEDTI